MFSDVYMLRMFKIFQMSMIEDDHVTVVSSFYLSDPLPQIWSETGQHERFK